MGFRENWLAKIKIDTLAQSILHAMGPPQSGQRIDLDLMRRLVEMGPYTHRRERDLDLYFIQESDPLPHILVLDNELKIYRTTAEDVALRKSPTVKEMVSIRNAIKILNDSDVVICRKADTVQRIRQELISALDLAYDHNDIQALTNDGLAALTNNYTDGLVEVAMLFAELLDLEKAPRAFQANHFNIWGKLNRHAPGDTRFGPVLLVDLMHNELKMISNAISTADKAAMLAYKHIISGKGEPDLTGQAVLEALQQSALEAIAP